MILYTLAEKSILLVLVHLAGRTNRYDCYCLLAAGSSLQHSTTALLVSMGETQAAVPGLQP